MADQFPGAAGRSPGQGTNPGSQRSGSQGSIGEISGAAKSMGSQAASAGRSLADQASSSAGSAANAMRGQAESVVDSAKGMASQAADKLKETVDGQKTAGAEYVHGIADAMRRAAREFDSEVPIVGSYMRRAADQVENVSQSIKNGDIEDLVQTAQSFARRQPTAFFGIAALAGFGVIRFLKSSAEGHARSSGAGAGRQAGGPQQMRSNQASL